MSTTTQVAVKQPWTQAQIDLMTRTCAKGATKDEMALFLNVAKKAGLDPFTRQIHFVKRKVYNKITGNYDEIGTIQTGIDGYRAIAERSGTLGGIDDAIYDDEQAIHPNKASVTVYRMIAGNRVAFTASARWNEYAQKMKDGTPTGLWAKMPYLMLGKCAEALALRKAFPNDLSGLYTNEEMSQVENERVIYQEPTQKSKEEEIKDLMEDQMTPMTFDLPKRDVTKNRNSGY